MQKIGSFGGDKLALVTMSNQEKPVEEEVDQVICMNCVVLFHRWNIIG